MTGARHITILLIEDDMGHARLIEKNLRRAGIINEIIHRDNGQKALDFLFDADGAFRAAGNLPLLILLDLNMPVMDGYQFLARLRAHDRTRNLPVVILTTTDNPQEISRCYEMGCNLYVTKPVEYEQFSQAIRNLGLFLSIVQVPERL